MELFLHGTSADAVIAILEGLGAVRVTNAGEWLLAVPPETSLSFYVMPRQWEDVERLQLGQSIDGFAIGQSEEQNRDWSASVASALGVSAAEAFHMMLGADVRLTSWSKHPAGQERLRDIVRRLLETYDGFVHAGSQAWTSEDVRNGRLDGMPI
jgi:hypothetical protein